MIDLSQFADSKERVQAEVETRLGRAVIISPEQPGDGFAKDAKTYGESFSAVILRSHGNGKGSVRVTGGNLEVDGASVGPGYAGPFLIEVASSQNCSLAGYYTIQLVQ